MTVNDARAAASGPGPSEPFARRNDLDLFGMLSDPYRDDSVWWARHHTCGGCTSRRCHDGPCTEVGVVEEVDTASGARRLLCGKCPDRQAAITRSARHVSAPATTTVGR
jgi:hypothetical protein